jgi:hypothetical protein
MGADKANIQAWLCAAIRIAKEQKSVSLEKRAEATYAEYVAKERAGQEDVDFEYLFGNIPAAP